MKSIGYLVTVFNEHKTVEEAIQQVININYTNKKILVIDNGSTDGSKEIIKNFDQKYIKFILRDKNEGFGKSIQEGIKFLDTDYIYIQYSDLEYDHLRSLDMMEYAIKNELDAVLGSRLLAKHMMKFEWLLRRIERTLLYISPNSSRRELQPETWGPAFALIFVCCE